MEEACLEIAEGLLEVSVCPLTHGVLVCVVWPRGAIIAFLCGNPFPFSLVDFGVSAI